MYADYLRPLVSFPNFTGKAFSEKCTEPSEASGNDPWSSTCCQNGKTETKRKVEPDFGAFLAIFSILTKNCLKLANIAILAISKIC